jgi:hypothetical protein
MQARDLLRHLKGIESQQRLADRYGGSVELTGIGFWLWRPPSGEAWQAWMNDEHRARMGIEPEPTSNAPPTADSEPEETPRERRRRLRLANRDKRITWA